MENFEDIKVGDEVIITNSFYEKVCRVTRTTKTLIVADNVRFNKKDGFEFGLHGYAMIPHLKRATPEALAAIMDERKRHYLISKITGYPYHTMSTEELEKVYDFINK